MQNKKPSDQEATFYPDFLYIPAAVAFDAELQPLDSKVYSIVYWLERLKDGRCFASNSTLAKLSFSSSSGIAHSLTRLRDKGYIACEYDDNGQRKEIMTLVFPTVNPSSNEQGGVAQMSNIKSNTNTKNITSDLTDERKDEIRKIYKLWLIWMKVDPETRLHGTTDDKHAALEVAAKEYKLTPKRRAAIIHRLDDAGYDMLVRAVRNLGQAGEFYRGDNDRGWKADLADFLCRSYEKVEEWATKNNKEGE